MKYWPDLIFLTRGGTISVSGEPDMHAGSKPQGWVVPWGGLSSAQALIMPHLLSIAGPHPTCCSQPLNPVLTVSDQGSEVNISSSWWPVQLTMNQGLFSQHTLFPGPSAPAWAVSQWCVGHFYTMHPSSQLLPNSQLSCRTVCLQTAAV